jgi:hypothetical protein
MRPRQALRSELYRVLDAALSVDVVVQRQTRSADEELVMIEAPETPSRGDIKADTGHQISQTIRVHTRYPKGAADVGRRDELAEDVIDALNNATIDPTDHRVVHWPQEPTNETPVGYEDGGDRAFDLLLTYDIHTQIKATI